MTNENTTSEISSLAELEKLLNRAAEDAKEKNTKIEVVLQDEYGLDLTDLPTFGGDEPDNTLGIWSWDAENIMVGDDFEIVSRAEISPGRPAGERGSDQMPRLYSWVKCRGYEPDTCDPDCECAKEHLHDEDCTSYCGGKGSVIDWCGPS